MDIERSLDILCHTLTQNFLTPNIIESYVGYDSFWKEEEEEENSSYLFFPTCSLTLKRITL